MKNQWPIWLFIIGVVVVVLFAFNYNGGREVVSLSEIFPEDEIKNMPAVEYEFVTEETGAGNQEMAAVAATAMTEPAAPAPQMAEQKAAEVKPQPVARQAAPQPKPQALTSDLESNLAEIPFTIQTASYKERTMAEKAASKMKDKGYPAFVSSADLGDKGIWYRIYVGRFQTKTQAEEFLSKLKDDYQGSFIISPKR